MKNKTMQSILTFLIVCNVIGGLIGIISLLGFDASAFDDLVPGMSETLAVVTGVAALAIVFSVAISTFFFCCLQRALASAEAVEELEERVRQLEQKHWKPGTVNSARSPVKQCRICGNPVRGDENEKGLCESCYTFVTRDPSMVRSATGQKGKLCVYCGSPLQTENKDSLCDKCKRLYG